ncbi:RagB/SusD family nutrient uptake outer membrane protein [Chondrinema litorale]|uniref:RagB/SusD family nutrient uptake outer membrane protein n=1 Tax=Chondrinema litorale TaxID=2994555 RepID=UPI002543CBE8|nr:RagB/SusD family nutrient uptake outer membrane protein [Chondrinema litorale]UZR96267.1 RagB/SusD family nutrient uptake outer membrane protein [Chondrinema litorale]
MKSYKIYILFAWAFLSVTACEEPLDENIYSQLTPSTLFTTEDGISSVMNSAYAYSHRAGVVETWSALYLGASAAGEIWGAGGSIEALWTQLQDFTWTATHAQIISLWPNYYYGIRDANIVLDNIENSAFSDDFIKTTTAEALFVRGWCYSELFNLYGPLPLYTSSTDDPLQARATEAETKTQIESDLTNALASLPDVSEFGKANKGTARAVLCKYYLNSKQWQKAADMAQAVIDMGTYSLQANYSDIFSLTNEGNSEMVWALPKDGAVQDVANNYLALTYPNKATYPEPYPNNNSYAAVTYLFDDFVNSFDPADIRKELIVTSWTNVSGVPQQGLGNDKSIPGKYPWDPNSVSANQGNDVPAIRYADILLSRAEALNELSGPTQEAIDLINQVRERAQAPLLQLADYDQSSLLNAILQERRWEFFHEGKNREDLLRHDMFISDAVARGKNATAYQALYPIPQYDIDANPLLEQNDGY